MAAQGKNRLKRMTNSRAAERLAGNQMATIVPASRYHMFRRKLALDPRIKPEDRLAPRENVPLWVRSRARADGLGLMRRRE
jgi:hypothetical protein